MLKKESVFKKIFLDNMILVIFTLVLYCSFVFVYEYEMNKKSAMQESVELTNKINRALRDYINQIDGTISSFYYEMYQNESGALATFLGSEEESGYAKVQQVKALDKYFAKLFVMRNDFVDVYIYSNSKNYIYSNYGGKTLDYKPNNQEWYKDTLDKDGKTNIMFNYVAEQITYKKPVIGFSRLFKNINEGQNDEAIVVVLDFKMENMDDLFDNYISNDYTSIFLVDSDGNVVYQRGAENGLEQY